MYVRLCIDFYTIVYRQNSITKSEQLNITSNGTIILRCKFDGIKLGMIQWFRNRVHIDFTVSS